MKYLLIILILASCSPAAKLRRAEKLINKAEELGAKWHIDTMTLKVPYAVPETVLKQVHVAMPGDTVRIEKERLKIKVVKLPGDSIFVEGKCEGDTLIIEVPTTITKTIAASGYSIWQMVVLALVFLLVGYGVRAFMRR